MKLSPISPLVALDVGGSFQSEAIDAEDNSNLNLVEGVENFTDRVLFITGECQTYIGADWQWEQMVFFPNADLAVIPDAGHGVFREDPADSIAVMRDYLNS